MKVEVLETTRFERWLERFAHFAMFPQMRRHLAAAFALHEQAAEGAGYDAVEVVDWGFQFIPWTLSSRTPFLVQLHGSDGQIALKETVAGREAEGSVSLLIERACMSYAPVVSGYSTSNASWWSDLLGREINYTLPPFSCEVSTEASLERIGWMTFGRVQKWKGPQVACEAWKLLGDAAPELHWYGRSTVHGESGEMTSEWLGRSFPEVWGGKILHHDPVTPSEVSRLMVTAKVVLIPSVWDTFNLVTAEAMAHECVVLVSDDAGAADLIEHGVNGFVFSSGDAVALASLVREIETLPQDRLHEIGRKAAGTVTRVMNPNHIAKQKLALLQEAKLPSGDGSLLKQVLLSPTLRSKDGFLTFLDCLPIKALFGYVLKRIIQKMIGKSQ